MSVPTPISRAVRPTPTQIAAMRRGGLNVFGLTSTGSVKSATLDGETITPLLAEALLRQADRDLRGEA